MTLTKIGASLGGAADTLLVTQTGHGFVSNDVGKAVKMLSTGLYDLAKADAITNADSVGIILQRIDANTLLLALSGRVTVDACVPTGNPGTVLFLPTASIKNTTTGYLTATEPSSASEVSKPMAVITISGSEMILFQMRGEVISSGAVSIADDSVTSAKIVDGAIVNADINASADIAFTKLADLTDGNILVGNGSNVPTSVNPSGDIDISNAGVFELNATAISGFAAKTTVVGADTVLLGDSAASGALKQMTRANFVAGVGGGKLELIESIVADNDSTLTISGVVGYDTYLIIVSGLHPSHDNANMRMRFGTGTSGSPVINTGGSDYAWHQTALEPSSTSYSATASTGANYISLNNSGTGTDTGESFGGVWWLFASDDDSAGNEVMPMISGHQVGVRQQRTIGGGGVIANRTSVIALTQVQILPHANTIISGRMTIYGVAHD